MLSSAPSRRELLVWLLALLLGFSAIVMLRSESADAGATGPATQVVYIATGLNFPDALGAAAAAGLGLGPVLLVQQDAIPAETLTELNRLDPPSIIIVGGTGVISDLVKTELEALSFSPDVTRVSGGNRYATAAALSAATFPTSGLYPRVAHANTLNADDVDGDALTVSITAPMQGTLIMGAVIDAALAAFVDDDYVCALQVDDVDVPGTLMSVVVDNGTDSTDTLNGSENCAATGAIEVTAGSHDVSFRIGGLDGVTFSRASMWVIWVPFDGNGAIPET